MYSIHVYGFILFTVSVFFDKGIVVSYNEVKSKKEPWGPNLACNKEITVTDVGTVCSGIARVHVYLVLARINYS